MRKCDAVLEMIVVNIVCYVIPNYKTDQADSTYCRGSRMSITVHNPRGYNTDRVGLFIEPQVHNLSNGSYFEKLMLNGQYEHYITLLSNRLSCRACGWRKSVMGRHDCK
jgi:hypothetical protein